MKWFRRIALGVVTIVVIAFGALFVSGNGTIRSAIRSAKRKRLD